MEKTRNHRLEGALLALILFLGLSGAAQAGSYLVFPGEELTAASLLEASREGGALEGKIVREMPFSGALVADLSPEEAEALSGRFTLVPADLKFHADADPLADPDGHGTAVTGMVVGNRTGVCPYVKVVPVKIADDTGVSTTGSMQDALEYTLSLARNELRGKRILINFSHSADPFYSPQSAYESFFNNLYRSLSRYNIFFGSAAGNRGLNLSDGQYAYPASVSATNEATVSAYRQSGSTIVLDKTMNYGHDIVEVAAPGTSVVTTANALSGYTSVTGTSFATPYVTGLAAYLWSHDPGLTPTGLKDALIEMSTKHPAMEVIAGGALSPELLMAPLPSGPVSRPAEYLPHSQAWQLDSVAVLRDHPDAFDFADVVVVVWDTGVTASHPELKDHLRTDLAHDSTAAVPILDDGGSGCSLGFAPAALLLVVPLMLVKKER